MTEISSKSLGKNRTEFGIWLRARMAERGLTVNRLAERSRVSPKAVDMLLAGRIWMGPRLSRALAYGLRLPVDEILRAAGFLYPEDDREDAEQRELIGLLDHCDDHQRWEILRYARRVVGGTGNLTEKMADKKMSHNEHLF